VTLSFFRPRAADAASACLAGVHVLDTAHCAQITDAALAHPAGWLSIAHVPRITSAAFAHLAGVPAE